MTLDSTALSFPHHPHPQAQSSKEERPWKTTITRNKRKGSLGFHESHCGMEECKTQSRQLFPKLSLCWHLLVPIVDVAASLHPGSMPQGNCMCEGDGVQTVQLGVFFSYPYIFGEICTLEFPYDKHY